MNTNLMSSSSSIQVYTGDGSSSLCSQGYIREITDLVDPGYHKIEEFCAGYDAGLDRGSVKLVVIPGGNSFEMIPSMTRLSSKIQEAVHKRKASLLGSCAGALVCTSNGIDPYNKDVDFTYDSRLTLNPLKTRFPYYLPHSSSYKDPENKSAIEVEWLPSYGNYSSRNCLLYHAFGPAFPMETIPTHERFNVRPLVTYRTPGSASQADGPAAAAVLYRPAEEGASPRLFTGVHPEIGVEDFSSPVFLKQFDESNKSHVVNLTNQLQGSEQIRKEMLRSWLLELGLKMRY
jgi:glutamine amidotransferase-like uncharacterized protein